MATKMIKRQERHLSNPLRANVLSVFLHSAWRASTRLCSTWRSADNGRAKEHFLNTPNGWDPLLWEYTQYVLNLPLTSGRQVLHMSTLHTNCLTDWQKYVIIQAKYELTGEYVLLILTFSSLLSVPKYLHQAVVQTSEALQLVPTLNFKAFLSFCFFGCKVLKILNFSQMFYSE